MNEDIPLADQSNHTYDPLAPYRERIMYPILIAASICFTPFFINSFLQKRYAGGLATFIVVLTCLIDAWAIRKGKRAPIPFAFLLAPMAVAMGISIHAQGIFGALWAYPAVMACFFVLSRRAANICGLLLLAGGTAMIYSHIDPGIAMRFFASYALTIVVTNYILTVVMELQRELVSQTITDPLTGAFNRRYMNDRLADTIELARRKDAPAALLLLDIDHFKRINDQFGHASGDLVLKKLVSLVKQHTRKTDQLFRIGGEEFLLLLPQTDAAEASVVAEHLRQAAENASWIDGWPVTISVGVSQHESNDTADQWIRKADRALYRAKEAGRNQVVFLKREGIADLR